MSKEKLRNAVITLEDDSLDECEDYIHSYIAALDSQELDLSIENEQVENNPFFMLRPPQDSCPPFILYKKDNLHYCRVNITDTDNLMKYFIENGKPGDIFKFELMSTMSYDYQDYSATLSNEAIYKFIDFVKNLKVDLDITTVCILNVPIIGELAYIAFVVDKIELGEMGYLALGYHRIEMKDSKWEFHKLYAKNLLHLGVVREFITETDKENILAKKTNVILTNDKIKIILDKKLKKLEQQERDKINIINRSETPQITSQ